MNENDAPSIVWFRRDLRIQDNPALNAATERGAPIICLYIYETDDTVRSLGGASLWWLDKSLKRLAEQLNALGGKLTFRRGLARETLAEVISETGAQAVYWNRRYEQSTRDIDADIKESLKHRGLTVESFNGSLVTEPWTQKTGGGKYYRVFTPFWKSVQANYTPPAPLPAPDKIITFELKSDRLTDWHLHPENPDWSEGFNDMWQPGEAGAANRLNDFLDGPVSDYREHRNRPDLMNGTSGLSPHLAFGEISPAQIWRAVKSRIAAAEISEKDAMVFLSEVIWRDFSYVLLYHNPHLARENFRSDFNHMPWVEDAEDLEKWQRGLTGYPIVDAGMRQLWHTGWMHNRVRMIVASFLTKHLMIHWTHGEDWFWDTLVDADPASNSASWQWTAGSGADAAPYFRIFNPITQGEKFDETGDYVRKWCPELAQLPNKYLFRPWEADEKTLKAASVTLGSTYPLPIVDHPTARKRALAAYETLRLRRDAA
ncbi:MAG: deoxyribodipyrimidine photo-lyase [Henriciella sp.]